MKTRARFLAIIAMGVLLALPAWAERGYGHGGGHDHFWGPFGFLLGSAIVFSALQPHPVYYPPQVVYVPPYAQPVYVTPASGSQSYVEQAYVSPPAAQPPPPSAAQHPSSDSPGNQWWYYCKQPSGYYP